jgi:hypothetical protein
MCSSFCIQNAVEEYEKKKKEGIINEEINEEE